MSAPIVFAVGHVEVDLREGCFSLPWVASRREERRGACPRARVLPFTRREDAEAVCVTWALELLEAAEAGR